MTTPTLARLREIAIALAELRDRVVFLGGAAIPVLVTDPGAPPPRVTDDVDAIADHVLRAVSGRA